MSELTQFNGQSSDKISDKEVYHKFRAKQLNFNLKKT